MIDIKLHQKHIEYEKKIINVAVASENGKDYRLVNKSKFYVTKVHIDGGVFKQELCCDFLFLTHERVEDKYINQDAILVELKGVDVKHAIDQIESTVNKLKFSNKEYILKGRIVASKGIPVHLRPSNFTRLDALLKKNGGDLQCKTKLFEEHV